MHAYSNSAPRNYKPMNEKIGWGDLGLFDQRKLDNLIREVNDLRARLDTIEKIVDPVLFSEDPRNWGDNTPGSSPFEGRLVKLINGHFDGKEPEAAIAFRLKQSRFGTQHIDVLVDSINKAHYLAIECKSIGPPEEKGQPHRKLYFSDFSVDKKGEHQITRIGRFLRKGGRFGILAIELRKGKGKGPQQTNDIYFIPFHHVEAWFEAGIKGIDSASLDGNFPKLEKVKGLLNWDFVMSELRNL